MTQVKGENSPLTGNNEKFRSAQSSLNQGKEQVLKSNPEPRDVYTSHNQIISALMDNRDINLSEYGSVLLECSDEGSNLLHKIILKLKQSAKGVRSTTAKQPAPRKPKAAPKAVLDFVERLVMDDPELLIKPNDSDIVALLHAAQHQVDIFFQVFNLFIPDNVMADLEVICTNNDQHTTCALASVNELWLEKCRPPESATIPATGGKNERNERQKHQEAKASKPYTCHHGQVDMQQLRAKNQAIKKVLEEFLAQDSCLELLICKNNFDPGYYSNKDMPTIPLERFRVLLRLCPSHSFKPQGKLGLSPLQLAIKLYDDFTLDHHHLFLVIKELVERSSQSIYFKAEHAPEPYQGKTAYQMLKELKVKTVGTGSSKQVEDDKRAREGQGLELVTGPINDGKHAEWTEFGAGRQKGPREMTEDLLKIACIGASATERALDAKLAYLYFNNAKLARQITLNLRGESKKLDNAYIAKMQRRSKVTFETALASVQLPYWDPGDADETSKIAADKPGLSGSAEKQDSDPYTEMFSWLWESDVRKIFSVEVEDTGPAPHSNAAIRESLRKPLQDGNYQDFCVDIFKWKKYDICTETVCHAAPNAKEVYLYSSGNTAVLRGWACSSGLYKMNKLERLTIEVYASNMNDENDCRDYEDEMKQKLVKNCPRLEIDAISVSYPKSLNLPGDEDDANTTLKDKESGSKTNDTPSLDDWIKEMEPFKQFSLNLVNSVHPDEKPRVKVAVLDDGVSLDGLKLNGGKGKSFRVDNVEYWVGPCTHGTMMVDCIRKLCPMAELYVGRLDDSGIAEKQQFTTDSCYKALKWAMEEGVDIISMSWSFKKNEHGADEWEEKFIKELKQAVRSDKVILFASLPDKGARAEISKYVPVGIPKIIRIGSATMYGEEAKEIIFADRDFLLPGEEITTRSGESDKGSSYATAYAAGLAALALYSLRAHKTLEDLYLREDTMQKIGLQDEDITKRLDKAATMDGMRTIFKVLSNQGAKDVIPGKGFFLRPYLTLGRGSGPSERDRIKYLRALSRKILPLD